MKLSILDQAPISEGQTARDALLASVRLAQHGEKLGYQRFWIAEHHDLFGLACPNPDVMIGIIGSKTNTIRIGAGAVLLPYYKPFRVAETYNLLATLYPDRIDLGTGRAPGGSAEVSLALSDNYLKQVQEYEKSIDELSDFLYRGFPASHPYGKISPSPVPAIAPQMWMLGSSEKSANLAADKNMSYAFADFMTDFNGPEIVQTYQRAMVLHKQTPYVIITVHVICAETTEKAESIALGSIIWKLQQEKEQHLNKVPSMETTAAHIFTEEELSKVEKIKQNMIIGDQKQVKRTLQKIQNDYTADELMIVTITYLEEDKLNSYELVKNCFE